MTCLSFSSISAEAEGLMPDSFYEQLVAILDGVRLHSGGIGVKGSVPCVWEDYVLAHDLSAIDRVGMKPKKKNSG